ncbi:hypothetical protein F5Y10DRAFT_255568 [Nemania abortiva]|nr:hypothetical protein F5Y10DRAFT_255568 [Nemania abortiva]
MADVNAGSKSDEVRRGDAALTPGQVHEPSGLEDSQEFPPISPTVTLAQGNNPAGEEDARRDSSSSEDFRYSSDTVTLGPGGAPAPFPNKLNLYYPAGRLYLAKRIGAALYSVQVNYRQLIPVDAEITLRTGPDSQSPPLATLQLAGSNVVIWASNQSSLDLSQVAVSINGPGGRFGIGYGTVTFAVPIPAEGKADSTRLAEFEWRHSIVPEVLNANAAWKLKRKPSSSPEAGSSSSGRSAEGETVAVLSFKKDSRSKILTIRFEGSGATAEFGELWRAVTILTALAIYQHKPSSRQPAPSGSQYA